MVLNGCVMFMPDRIHYSWDDNQQSLPSAGGGVPQNTLAFADIAAAPDVEDAAQRQAPFVGLAFSGGGSRAATFAAAGAEALAEYGLLDQVTHISSVSGGSFAASYLAVRRPHEARCESDPEVCRRRSFAEYKKVMRYNYLVPMELRQIVNVNRHLSPTRRITSLQEVLDNQFLDDATFGSLDTAPALFINAASYDDARRFVFSNTPIADTPLKTPPFDEDILRTSSFSRGECLRRTPDDFPLSLAVAASAGFPPALGPVAIEAPPGCGVATTTYWHLGDGGILENTGVETLQEIFLRAAEKDNAFGKGVVFSFDSGTPRPAEESLAARNLNLWTNDPGRVVSILYDRAQALREIVWRGVNENLDEPLRIVSMRYDSGDLMRELNGAWPESCDVGKRRGDTFQAHLARVPLSLKISDCDADLVEASARALVRDMVTREKSYLSELGVLREPLQPSTRSPQH